MAQTMFQMQRLWDGFKYEDLQGLQQGTILRSVSIILNRIISKETLMLTSKMTGGFFNSNSFSNLLKISVLYLLGP